VDIAKNKVRFTERPLKRGRDEQEESRLDPKKGLKASGITRVSGGKRGKEKRNAKCQLGTKEGNGATITWLGKEMRGRGKSHPVR